MRTSHPLERAVVAAAAFIVLFSIGVWLGCAPGYHADEPPTAPRVDPTLVYHGNATAFESPAEVSSDEVYAEIDEYRQVVDERLKERDPRYWFLLRRASERFRGALQREAKDLGHDLVAERGSVRWDKGAVPDLTRGVVLQLKSDARDGESGK